MGQADSEWCKKCALLPPAAAEHGVGLAMKKVLVAQASPAGSQALWKCQLCLECGSTASIVCIFSVSTDNIVYCDMDTLV